MVDLHYTKCLLLDPWTIYLLTMTKSHLLFESFLNKANKYLFSLNTGKPQKLLLRLNPIFFVFNISSVTICEYSGNQITYKHYFLLHLTRLHLNFVDRQMLP